MKNDALWAWKSFLRGHHPVPANKSLAPARYAIGDTLQYAGKMGLAQMEPRGDLSSTGYVLANVGKEYLVLDPGESIAPFTLMLETGLYEVEWYNVNSRKIIKAESLKVESIALIGFKVPFEPVGPAALYLRRSN